MSFEQVSIRLRGRLNYHQPFGPRWQKEPHKRRHHSGEMNRPACLVLPGIIGQQLGEPRPRRLLGKLDGLAASTEAQQLRAGNVCRPAMLNVTSQPFLRYLQSVTGASPVCLANRSRLSGATEAESAAEVSWIVITCRAWLMRSMRTAKRRAALPSRPSWNFAGERCPAPVFKPPAIPFLVSPKWRDFVRQ